MWKSVASSCSSVCGFVRRHKKMVIAGTLVVAATGVYYTTKKVLREAEEITQKMQKEIEDHQTLYLHIDRSKKESRSAFFRFVCNLRPQLYTALDVETLVLKLKQLKGDPQEKQLSEDLWEQVKVMTFTRYLVGIYSFGLLYLLVHIQISLLARQTLNEQTSKDNATSSDPETKKQFLSSIINYFLKEGLPKLIQHVQSVVQSDQLLAEWKVREKTRVGEEEFFQLLQHLHQHIMPSTEETSELWNTFLFSSDLHTTEPLMEMYNEVQHVLESDCFDGVRREVLHSTFDLTWSYLKEHIFTQQTPLPPSPETSLQDKKDDLTPPLAKVIPAMKREAGSMLPKSIMTETTTSTSRVSAYCNEFSNLEALHRLCDFCFVEMSTYC